MHIIPVTTSVLKKGDDVVKAMCESVSYKEGDIIVLSSKVIATVEGAALQLQSLQISEEATTLSKKYFLDAKFCQAVIEETKRMRGRILPSCQHALLTELRPAGFPQGVLLVPNAGLDQSNIDEGYAIGWPHNPVHSVQKIRKDLMNKTGKNIAVIMSDSCCHPGRLGVTAFALTVSGLDPFISLVGTADLFGKDLKITQEAVADQLAVAGNATMGNAHQSIPAAIIRDHGYALSAYEGWVPGIEPEEDLFRGMNASQVL